MVQSGKALSERIEHSIPLMYTWHDKKYLGAAHGLAGIYYILLQVSLFTFDIHIMFKLNSTPAN